MQVHYLFNRFGNVKNQNQILYFYKNIHLKTVLLPKVESVKHVQKTKK